MNTERRKKMPTKEKRANGDDGVFELHKRQWNRRLTLLSTIYCCTRVAIVILTVFVAWRAAWPRTTSKRKENVPSLWPIFLTPKLCNARTTETGTSNIMSNNQSQHVEATHAVNTTTAAAAAAAATASPTWLPDQAEPPRLESTLRGTTCRAFGLPLPGQAASSNIPRP